jgi:hypothetical protein
MDPVTLGGSYCLIGATDGQYLKTLRSRGLGETFGRNQLTLDDHYNGNFIGCPPRWC